VARHIGRSRGFPECLEETIMHAFRIGRVLGIDIRVAWSWVFIFVLLTWNLSNAFSVWHPGWPTYESTVVAFAASLLFFGCILLHELAHSVVAMRFGVRVRSITLFLLGGVSDIKQEPPSPRAEFLTAVVGPLTSILLGLGFLAATFTSGVLVSDTGTALAGLARLGPLETLLVWLGPINLVIGVFNLVPAFPLDGGRVLRSILWGLGGDLERATRRASFIGQAFAWLFILTGIAMAFGMRVPFFGTGLAGGLWLAFIGWFLWSAASQTRTRLALDGVLAGHTVAELMRREVQVVPAELPITTLVHDYFVRSDDRAFPVMRDEQLLGVVTISDVRAVSPAEWGTTSVAAVMQPEKSVTTATPEETLVKAFEQFAQHDVDQLPVLEGGRLVGMLQRRDVDRRDGAALESRESNDLDGSSLLLASVPQERGAAPRPDDLSWVNQAGNPRGQGDACWRLSMSEHRAHESGLPVRVRRTATAEGELIARSVYCPGRSRSISLEECEECHHCDGVTLDPTERSSFVMCRRFPADLRPEPDPRRSPGSGATDLAESTPVSAVMARDVLCVTSSMGALELLGLLLRDGISGAPVVDELGRAIGVVSKTDLLRELERQGSPINASPRGAGPLELLGARKDALARTSVGELMMPFAYTISENASLAMASALMTLEGVHRLPVVTDDARRGVVGILSSLDVLRWLARTCGYLGSA